jgi:hypothetical protein
MVDIYIHQICILGLYQILQIAGLVLQVFLELSEEIIILYKLG